MKKKVKTIEDLPEEVFDKLRKAKVNIINCLSIGKETKSQVIKETFMRYFLNDKYSFQDKVIILKDLKSTDYSVEVSRNIFNEGFPGIYFAEKVNSSELEDEETFYRE